MQNYPPRNYGGLPLTVGSSRNQINNLQLPAHLLNAEDDEFSDLSARLERRITATYHPYQEGIVSSILL